LHDRYLSGIGAKEIHERLHDSVPDTAANKFSLCQRSSVFVTYEFTAFTARVSNVAPGQWLATRNQMWRQGDCATMGNLQQ
jgi:hypothetical protein